VKVSFGSCYGNTPFDSRKTITKYYPVNFVTASPLDEPRCTCANDLPEQPMIIHKYNLGFD
jgi:hypothetical protein